MRTVAVPLEALYEAFAKGKSAMDYKLDEMRFNEFQKGWNAALDYINNDTLNQTPNRRG